MSIFIGIAHITQNIVTELWERLYPLPCYPFNIEKSQRIVITLVECSNRRVGKMVSIYVRGHSNKCSRRLIMCRVLWEFSVSRTGA